MRWRKKIEAAKERELNNLNNHPVVRTGQELEKLRLQYGIHRTQRMLVFAELV